MNRVTLLIFSVLVVLQASVFGYALNMNNRLAILETQDMQSSPELDSVIQNQIRISTDIHQIIKVIKGLIIQVNYLTNELKQDKVKKQDSISQDNLQIG
jgi:RNA-binding protein YlmH